jgi:hypothetical protein
MDLQLLKDHVMISRRNASQITDIRSQLGANSDSDHFMVRIKYRPKISILLKHQCTRHLRCDISKLQDGTRVKKYRKSIREYVSNQLSNNSDVQQQWSTIKQYIYIYGEREQQKKSQAPLNSPMTGISG